MLINLCLAIVYFRTNNVLSIDNHLSRTMQVFTPNCASACGLLGCVCSFAGIADAASAACAH
jgi:hypothetical protein